MDEGIVLRVIGGFFRVLLRDGSEVESKPRGRLRKERVSIVSGDRVDVIVQQDGSGVIERVHPRRSQLKRPSVANVEQVVAVMAVTDPTPNYQLLDRLLVVAEATGLAPLIVWNKIDLVESEAVDREVSVYVDAGYDVIATSTRTGAGIEQLRKALADRISTLAGPSGVGKSALLNALDPAWERATGEVSGRLGLGRHTTRAVELLPLRDGGLVADTPGFGTLDVRDIAKEQLGGLWREVGALSHRCRYPGCLHNTEPDCAVKEAVAAQHIHPRRYENYVHLLEEIEHWEARRYS